MQFYIQFLFNMKEIGFYFPKLEGLKQIRKTFYRWMSSVYTDAAEAEIFWLLVYSVDQAPKTLDPPVPILLLASIFHYTLPNIIWFAFSDFWKLQSEHDKQFTFFFFFFLVRLSSTDDVLR